MASYWGTGDAAAGEELQQTNLKLSAATDQSARPADLIRSLEAAKHRAVEAEEYDKAKQCKDAIAHLEHLGALIDRLEDQKLSAVQEEDYDKAKALKLEIEQMHVEARKVCSASTSSELAKVQSAKKLETAPSFGGDNSIVSSDAAASRAALQRAPTAGFPAAGLSSVQKQPAALEGHDGGESDRRAVGTTGDATIKPARMASTQQVRRWNDRQRHDYVPTEVKPLVDTAASVGRPADGAVVREMGGASFTPSHPQPVASFYSLPKSNLLQTAVARSTEASSMSFYGNFKGGCHESMQGASSVGYSQLGASQDLADAEAWQEHFADARASNLPVHDVGGRAVELSEAQETALSALALAEEAHDELLLRTAIEEAQAAGISIVRLRPARKALAELESKKATDAAQRKSEACRGSRSKWNFGGRVPGPQINDRFREHEVELEERRLQAFSGRGQFRSSVEDEGDEQAHRYIDQERRREREQECATGGSSMKFSEYAASSFALPLPNAAEQAPCRRVRLYVFGESGAGLNWSPTWWGVRIDAMDETLAPQNLQLKDFIVEIAGRKLTELEAAECVSTFQSSLVDGVEVLVEQCCSVWAALPHLNINEQALSADLSALSEDYAVIAEVRYGTPPVLFLSGAQSAMPLARSAIEQLMGHYYTHGIT